VTLKTGGGQAVGASSAAVDGTGGDLVIGAATPASAHVIVDNSDRGTLPTRVKGLSPGMHRLRFEADRFQPAERTVDLRRGQVVDIGSVQLKLARGKITIFADEDSKVVLTDVDAHQDRQVHGPYPIPIDVDATHRWLVTANARGKREFNYDVAFDDGQ